MPIRLGIVLPKVSGPIRLTDRVESLLGEEIRSGRLRPGDKVPTEVELVKQLGVSRTVVREALSRLRSAGLVEPRQGLGVFVLDPPLRPLDLATAGGSGATTQEKMLQIVEVRRAIEGDATALAAVRATADDRARIRVALAAIDDAVAAGGDGVDEDLAFHRAIAESSHNAVMVATVRYLGRVLRDGIRVTRANEARRTEFAEQVRTEHNTIVDAIEAGDAARARSAARAHMKRAAVRLTAADESFWGEITDVDTSLDPRVGE